LRVKKLVIGDLPTQASVDKLVILNEKSRRYIFYHQPPTFLPPTFLPITTNQLLTFAP
jgi:hypothetical protein